MATEYARRRFTVDEYHKMGDAGILGEDDRVELLDGEIVQMSPINVPHAICVDLLNMIFAPHLAGIGIVRVQGPIFLDDINEPQPDIALLKLGEYLKRQQHPGPRDIMLLIEVADSTVLSDRQQKIPRYARAGIVEAWLVNIPKGIVEVYTDPAGGKYKSIRRLGQGDFITPQALPDLSIAVSDFLGRSS